MYYSEFVEVYEALASTSKKLEKTAILAGFLKKLDKEGRKEWIYLLRGKVLPDYDSREFGISRQLAMKAIANAFGISSDEIAGKFNKIGDLGEIARFYVEKRKQSVLFSNKLEVGKVFETLHKLFDLEGKGSVDKKMDLIAELLNSADGNEAKYIVRTLLGDLRVGAADALLVDAIAHAFYEGEEAMRDIIQEKYDLANDSAVVFKAAVYGKDELDKISIVPGKPVNVMLAVKADDIEDGFRICGVPAAIEFKYDGFRVLINKDVRGEITLFSRRLESLTNQFPDVVEAVKKYIKGGSFILDAEVVGYDSKTKRYKPFESISQRIKRKYDIEDLINKLPVEVNVFDILYLNGENLMNKKFSERRKLVEKIVKEKERVIRPSVMIIAKNEEEAQKFYEKALEIGEEGIMMKKLDAFYKQGRKVGYMAKIKPIVKDLDLVIVGAEYGTGKRAGRLSSYIVACKSDNEFLEIGKVSSGLKEKEEEGTSYEEMTKLLKPLIIGKESNMVKIKPKIVVSVTYQNIQESPSYSSGYALRFPRITAYRPDRKADDISGLNDIKKEVKKGVR